MKKFWLLGLLICPLIWADLFSTIVYSKILYLQIFILIGTLISFKDELQANKFLISLGALFLWAALSSLWAVDPLLSFTGQYWRGTGLIFYSSILLLLFTQKADEEFKLILNKTYLGLALLISIVTSIHFIFIKGSPSLLFTGNPSATALILGSAFLLLLKSQPFQAKTSNYALGFQLVLGMVLTGSRTGFFGLIFSSLIYALLENRKYFKKVLLSALGGVFFIWAYHLLFNSEFLNAIILRSQNFHRLKIWTGAFNSFLDKALLGWGFQGLYDGFWNNYPGSLGSSFQWIDNAHSLPLNILSELGLIGFTIFSIALFYLYKEVKNSESKNFWTSYALFIGAYLLVQPIYVDSLLVLIISYILFSNSKDSFTPPKKLSLGLKSLGIVSLIVITMFQVGQNSSLINAKEALVTSRDYRPFWRNYYESRFKLIDPQGTLYELSSQFNSVVTSETITPPDKKIFSRLVLNEFKKFEAFSSHRPRFLDLYGVWLMRNQNYQEANDKFDKILKRAPNNSQILILKAESEALRGFQNNSIDLFERAEKIDPLNIKIKMNLAKLYMDLGYKEKAISKIKEASEADPTNKKLQTILNQF